MSFTDKPLIKNLSGLLNQKFLGENTNTTLDLKNTDGSSTPYGQLGSFANSFDKSAQRSYTEAGWFSTNQFQLQARNLEILWQQPTASILIKKRAFSSLAENNRPDLMSKDERLFLKATKTLFNNKLKQIRDFEALCKLEKVTTALGYVHDALVPVIIDLADSLSSSSGGTSSELTSFFGVVKKVKQAFTLSQQSDSSYWVPSQAPFWKSQLGEGTGVMELTGFTNFSTNIGVKYGSGTSNITFSDPYRLMYVTDKDIEQALLDTVNIQRSSSIYKIGEDSLLRVKEIRLNDLNTIRINRGVSPINIILSADTLLGKRVRAILDPSGFEIDFKFMENLTRDNIDPKMLQGVDNDQLAAFGVLPNQAFTNEEFNLFAELIKVCYDITAAQLIADKETKNWNKKLNPIRKKLSLHYKGKFIINPMDTVHIYINSRTSLDEKIVQGLTQTFNAASALQGASSLLDQINNAFSPTTFNDIEKSIFVGPTFPSWLWPLVRNVFLNHQNGVQVFSGVINGEVRETFSSQNGTYTLNVNVQDNTSYFNLGVVNFKPSVDVFNANLYDPLTPFDIKFDQSTGFVTSQKPLELLDENKELISKSDFLKYKMGPNAGGKPTLENFQRDASKENNLLLRKTFYDPDGFVYKYKEGIGSLVAFQDAYSQQPQGKISAPAITQDPFAGQDIMNVLSLLITGEPYNFATFYKTARDFDSFARDPVTGEDPSVSYFKSLTADLTKRNYLYGNFVPFKRLNISENDFKNAITGQLQATDANQKLQEKLNLRADLADKILAIDGIGDTNIKSKLQAGVQQLKLEMQKVDADINQISNDSFQAAVNDSKNYLNIVGNDISINYDNFLNNQQSISSNAKLRRELRKKINYLTQRLYWKVKANEDFNMLIVDDSYDKDYDLMAFEKSFQNEFSLYKSEYSNISSYITKVAELLQLEVFSDSQGHIQIRTPQYNKIPSSVFYKMLQQKYDKGIQVFPQFLEDLYAIQIDGAFKNIEFTEDKLRLYCALLGKNTDKTCEDLLKGAINPGTSTQFTFLSSEISGKILSYDTSFKMLIESSPDTQQDVFNKPIPLEKFIAKSITGLTDIVNQQSSIRSAFDIIKRKNILEGNSPPQVATSTPNPISYDAKKSERVDTIKLRISQNQGQVIDIDNYFPNTKASLIIASTGRVANKDVLGIFDKINETLIERQKFINIAAKALKNLNDGLSLNSDNGTSTKLLVPGLIKNGDIPEAFEHMIENEGFDDLGPGSGKRYIIKPYQIKLFTLAESPPDHTSVTVQGSYGDGFLPQGSLPNGLNIFENGNALTTAQAIDYDLYRMYGYRQLQTVRAPFLTNPTTQIAPYAVMLLNLARANIKQGSITLVGNEYHQAGDVVYIEDYDLLFYVESVQHTFNPSGTFETTLSLKYGHNPGEYIPTPLDIVGKILYQNKDLGNFYHFREGDVFNQSYLGSFVASSSNLITNTTFSELIDENKNPFAKQNAQILENVSYQAFFATTKQSENNFPVVEIRTYFNSKGKTSANQSANATLINLANEIKSILTGSSSIDKNIFKNLYTLDKSKVKVTQIDIGTDDIRYCSSKAFYLGRSLLDKSYGASQSTAYTNDVQKIDAIIHDSIIECWIYFDNKEAVIKK